MPDRLIEIENMLRSGATITYDVAAELFEMTSIGRSLNVPREQAIALLRRRFTTEQELTASMRAYLATADKMTAGPGGPLH